MSYILSSPDFNIVLEKERLESGNVNVPEEISVINDAVYVSLRLPLGVRYVRDGTVINGVGIIVLIEKVTCFELLYMLPEAVIVQLLLTSLFAVKREV